MNQPHEPVHAVISYAHGPDDERVIEFADQLNNDGIDCDVDAYVSEPAEGWARWMNAQMTDRVVLVACSSDYYRRFRLEEKPGVGLGATFESGLLIQRVLESQGANRSVIPVLLRPEDAAFIPEFLRDVTRYDLSREGDYEKLHRRLTQRPTRQKPPLGPLRNFSSPTPSVQPQSARPAPVRQVVLFFADGVGACTVEFVEIERSGQSLKMTVVPADGEESTFLSRLVGNGKPFAVAYGTDAFWVRIKSAKDVVRDRRMMELTLQDESPRGSIASEPSYNGISADKIAEMRARRILLDEKLPSTGGTGWGAQLNDSTLEIFVRGSIAGDSVLTVTESPLVVLRRTSTAINGEFLLTAKLFCVLFLRLSRTVQHVVSLTLTASSNDAVSVQFVGVRERRYSNADPARIEVRGICQLR